ncbi:hypothetical protein V6N13_012050 [Hibiscus sabdariffa]
MEESGNRAEAIRLLGIAEKLLQSRDFNGSRDFAILAQETEPLLDGSDQILAIADVILAAEKRINNHQDWYSILQIDGRSDDNDLIKKQYRRLALLLHPDKNKFPFADHAFKLVADAWAILSNSSKKSVYDKELSLFTRIDLSSGGDGSNQAGKLPVTRKGQNQERGQYWMPNANTQNENQRSKSSTFWTACPYCYRLFEYHRAYEGCCLRCQNCEKAFHAGLCPEVRKVKEKPPPASQIGCILHIPKCRRTRAKEMEATSKLHHSQRLRQHHSLPLLRPLQRG